MTILTVKIPEGKTPDVSKYIREIGGEVVKNKTSKITDDDDEDNEVTHEVFFGENIRRLIKAFKS